MAQCNSGRGPQSGQGVSCAGMMSESQASSMPGWSAAAAGRRHPEGNILKLARQRRWNAQVAGRLLVSSEAARVRARDRGEDRERLEIIAGGRRVVVVARP